MKLRLLGGNPRVWVAALLLGFLTSITPVITSPGTKIKVWLFSEPVELGTSTVDIDGKFSGEFLIPLGTSIDSHTIQINGFGENQQLNSYSLQIQIVDVEKVPVNQGEQIPSKKDETGILQPENQNQAQGQTPKTLVQRKVLWFKTRVVSLDVTNKKRIADLRKKKVTGEAITCIGYIPSKPSNIKSSTALAKARATIVCKEFVKTLTPVSNRKYKVQILSLTKAPKTTYKRKGYTERVDILLTKPRV